MSSRTLYQLRFKLYKTFLRLCMHRLNDAVLSCRVVERIARSTSIAHRPRWRHRLMLSGLTGRPVPAYRPRRSHGQTHRRGWELCRCVLWDICRFRSDGRGAISDEQRARSTFASNHSFYSAMCCICRKKNRKTEILFLWTPTTKFFRRARQFK